MSGGLSFPFATGGLRLVSSRTWRFARRSGRFMAGSPRRHGKRRRPCLWRWPESVFPWPLIFSSNFVTRFFRKLWQTRPAGSKGLRLVNLLLFGVSAIAQKRLRMLMAFFCLSEVGLILLGVGSLSSAGIVGATYQQMVLGIGLTGFGLLIGIIEERVGHDNFSSPEGKRVIGGLGCAGSDRVAFRRCLVGLACCGFPGLGGFVGHAMLVIGSYSVHPVIVLLIGAALLMGVYYLFNMYKLVFLG